MVAGQKHKKKVSSKEKVETMLAEVGDMLDLEDDNNRRYCDACEVEVHSNHNWLVHLAGLYLNLRRNVKVHLLQEKLEGGSKICSKEAIFCDVLFTGKTHKKNKEKLDRLEVQVNCNSEFGSKRPTVDDLSGSVYCGICNTTVMASKENLENHFQGK